MRWEYISIAFLESCRVMGQETVSNQSNMPLCRSLTTDSKRINAIHRPRG